VWSWLAIIYLVSKPKELGVQCSLNELGGPILDALTNYQIMLIGL
jgi:hypothetical protein